MAHKIKITKDVQNSNRLSFIKNKKIMIISMIIILIIVISSISLFILIKNESNATIARVEIIPEKPGAGETIKIYAHLNGSLFLNRPRITYTTFFYSGEGPMGGGFPMSRLSGDKYVAEVGPYPEGVQIWFMITLSKANEVSYNESTIDIGDVQYSGDVWIFDVDYSPKNLENCESMEITAKFGHEGVISQPFITTELYYVFSPGGHSKSASTTDLGTYNSTTGYTQYSFDIQYYTGLYAPNETPDYEPFPSNTVIFYRIYIAGENYKYATPSYTITIP